MNIAQYFRLGDISFKFETDSFGAKTRSLGDTTVRPCLHSTGHFYAIIMNPAENVSLDGLDVDRNLGQKRSPGQIKGNPCYHSRSVSQAQARMSH